MIILGSWRLWRLRRRHPGWTIQRLRWGWRAYRALPSRDVHAGTLESLAGHMTALDAADAGKAVPS